MAAHIISSNTVRLLPADRFPFYKGKWGKANTFEDRRKVITSLFDCIVKEHPGREGHLRAEKCRTVNRLRDEHGYLREEGGRISPPLIQIAGREVRSVGCTRTTGEWAESSSPVREFPFFDAPIPREEEDSLRQALAGFLDERAADEFDIASSVEATPGNTPSLEVAALPRAAGAIEIPPPR